MIKIEIDCYDGPYCDGDCESCAFQKAYMENSTRADLERRAEEVDDG